MATTLSAIIDEVDAEVAALESSGEEPKSSKAILICSHAAPLIAAGRVLTGNMPDDNTEEDFMVFTAGLSKFVRRPASSSSSGSETSRHSNDSLLAEGTQLLRPEGGSSSSSSIFKVPDWMNGKGVGGGWDCIFNGDTHFLSSGAERGW